MKFWFGLIRNFQNELILELKNFTETVILESKLEGDS